MSAPMQSGTESLGAASLRRGMATGNPTGLDLLMEDHRQVSSLIENVQRSSDNERRKADMKTIIEELSKHAAVEEMILYPLLRRVGNQNTQNKGDGLADHAIEEHATVKNILAELENMEPSNNRFNELVAQLKSNVTHHVKEEEEKIFPVLRSNMKEDNLVTMGTVITQMKKVAPLRPHPDAPQTQPGVTLAGLAAGFMDRVGKMVGAV